MKDSTDWFCPCCGEYIEMPHYTFNPSPGDKTEWECPNCGARWEIEIVYRRTDKGGER